MVSKVKDERRVVLTKPLSFDFNSNSDDDGDDYKAPNYVQRILSLFKDVRPGSDLTNYQLPPTFNFPKSHLQCLGESAYCFGKNLLHECNNAESPLERFKCVVAWAISIARPLEFGVAPYNSILGETHHVSKGSLNVLLEQVSHHPPVSALHATDEKENIEMVWCQHPVPRFYGTRVEAEVLGKRQLKLLNHGETYVMNSPTLLVRFLPPGVDWVGKTKICCQESGLEAELSYTTGSFLGFRGKRNHSIKGKIFESSSLKTLYEVDGHWNNTVTVKDINNGKKKIIYDAKEVISGLKTPVIKHLQGVWASEAGAVWSEVSKAILSKNWEKAKAAKKVVEDKQRELAKERSSRGENWVPKHFIVSYTKEGGWDCLPIENWVPLAPIIVPF